MLVLLLRRPALEAQDKPPEPVKTSITVVGQVAAEAPASIEVVDREALANIPGVNADDRLRSVPGFSLFRRTSSLAANPTTQGVSLRGLGSSGASRTLVLWDGLPLNDPFGGWVYWTRIPPDEIERVEVSRGASTSVFGDRAMAGAIAFFSRAGEPWHLDASYEGGSRNSHEMSLGFAHLFSKWALSANTREFTTDGYWLVRERERGKVDRPAGVEFASGGARIDYLGIRDRLFLKTDLLAEFRENGTARVTNSTSLGTVAAHWFREMGSQGFSLLAWHTREQYHAIFSSISADRNAETVTYTQTVPSEETGGAALYRYGRTSWDALFGADAALVHGVSTDRLLPSGLRVGGGRLLEHGAFGQASARLGPVRFFGGLRHQFTGRGQTFLSPSAGLAAGKGRFRARGSVYRAFRAPTLNELFRDFRAGNTVTQANAALKPEKVFGAETGVDYVGESLHASVTLYRNSLEDLITNVTLSSTPSLIVRQRQNAASALARGVEAEAGRRLGPFQAVASYLFSDARYQTGERIAQSPRHQGSAQVSYSRGKTMAAVGVRSFGLQFDDDRNQFLLPGYATLQLAARRELRAHLWATAQVENLLDRQYLVAWPTARVPSIGGPRLVRVGLRWDGRVK